MSFVNVVGSDLVVKKFNDDKEVHSILVQLPLPAGIDEKAVLSTILPHKDVDALGGPLHMGTSKQTLMISNGQALLPFVVTSQISLLAPLKVVSNYSNAKKFQLKEQMQLFLEEVILSECQLLCC